MEATENELQPNDSKELLLVTEAREIVIKDSDTYLRADQLRGLLSDMIRVLEGDAKPNIDHWKAGLKEAQQDLKAKVDPLENLKARLRVMQGNYNAEQKRIAAAKQAELDRIARERARAEAAELKAELAKAELTEEAEEVKPEEPLPQIVQPDVPKTETVYVTRWHYEVEDFAALLKGYADGVVPAEAFQFNAGFLHKMTTTLKSELKYPGLKVWSTELPQ